MGGWQWDNVVKWNGPLRKALNAGFFVVVELEQIAGKRRIGSAPKGKDET
jgi:hypothetical protein